MNPARSGDQPHPKSPLRRSAKHASVPLWHSCPHLGQVIGDLPKKCSDRRQQRGGKGFSQRLSASGTACPPLEGSRHTAISSCVIDCHNNIPSKEAIPQSEHISDNRYNPKAVKGLVGRNEASPLPPKARRRLAKISVVMERHGRNHPVPQTKGLWAVCGGGGCFT